MAEPSYISEEVVIKEEDGDNENEYDDRESTPSSASFQEEGPSRSPSESFLDLCQSIDPLMDEQFQRDTWMLYDKVNAQCCLEGTKIPWMAAAIFAHQQLQKKSLNGPKFRYPLCKILEAGKLSAIEFFDRLSRISDIFNTSTSSRLLNQCRRIQNSLAISAVIYKKYLPIFRYVFSRSIIDGESSPIAPQQLFRLIWYLFINVKRQLSAASNEDLLMCFHVLLCCVDLVVRDLDAMDHQMALTTEFVEETKGGGESILSTLCNRFEGAALDAKHFKLHWFEKTIQEKIPLNEPAAFGQNVEHYVNDLEALYGEQLHQRGEFDERLFVPLNFALIYDPAFDAVSIEMLRRSEQSEWSVDISLLLRMSTQACLEKVDKFKATPLSGKAYIMSSEQFCPMTPAQAPSLSMDRLMGLIPEGWTLEDSELYRCFSDYHNDPLRDILQAVQTLSERFLRKIEEEQALETVFDQKLNGSIEKIKALVANLFYRFLERIIVFERSRMSVYRDIDFTAIVRKDEFLASLYAIVLELVLASNKSQRVFPWVLDMIGLPAVNFYKIIEVVVRSENGLSREMVKHLNRLEERVLEEYSWSLDSPLWNLLSRRADVVPSCKQVWNSEMGGDLYSPAKRMRVEDEEMPSSGVLTLFFRKIYYLASVRLVDLCERLKMNETTKSRVWTLVEHMLRTETNLMAGRHLDQNLMCCLYVAARSLNLEITFNQIMQQYKQQPQATSEVYRAVMVEMERSSDNARDPLDVEENLDEQPPAEHRVIQHETVDIITYYNRIFIQRMANFVKQLESSDFAALHQPLPVLRPFALTPNKRIISDRISVQALSPPSMNAKHAGYRLNAVGGGPVRTISRASDHSKPPTTLRRVVTAGGSVSSSSSATTSSVYSSTIPSTHHHRSIARPSNSYYATTTVNTQVYKY